MDFIHEIKKETGFLVEELDLGGGFGIRYLKDDDPYSLTKFVELVVSSVKERAAEHDLPLPKLLLEPGRSIVGEAGTTLYTVGAIKDVPGIRRYVAVDGGMTDNLRTALYEAKYEAVVANRVHGSPLEKVSIAGRACESGIC